MGLNYLRWFLLKSAIVAVLFVVSAGCDERPKGQGGTYVISENNNYALTKADSVELDENLTILSFITDVLVLPEGGVVIASEGQAAQVVVYDEFGKQKTLLGRQGNGPFEYGNPTSLGLNKRNVVVYDGKNLKLIEYTPTGKPVREIGGLKEGIHRFVFMNDDQVAMYRAGRGSEGYVGVFDIDARSFSHSYGKRTEAHNMLLMYAYSGGLARRNSTLYYASPATPRVNYTNIQNGTQGSFTLPDDDFYVPSIEAERHSHEDIQTYIFNVSRVRGVFLLNRYLIAQVEHGKWAEGRRTRLHLFEGKTWKDAITLSDPLRGELGKAAVAARGNSLFFLTTRSVDSGANLRRILERWTIQPAP